MKIKFHSERSETILAVARPEDLDDPDVVKRIEALAGRRRSFVRRFSFEDPVKRFCVERLGLTWRQVYGDPDDPVSQIRWENMPIRLRLGWKRGPLGLPLPCIRKGSMTVSEVMRHVAGGVVERLNPAAWIRCTITDIERWFVEEARVRMNRRRPGVRDEGRVDHAIVVDDVDECVQPVVAPDVASYNHLVAVITDCSTPERVEAVMEAGGEFLDPDAIAEEKRS